MTRLVLVLVLLVAGCAANPVRPECGGWRLAAANAVSFGMVGLGHCAGEAAIDRCLAAGGDAVGCRSAVFPPAPTRIIVNSPSPRLYRRNY